MITEAPPWAPANDDRDGLIRALVLFGRADLELVATLAIDQLDMLDGDLDLEPEVDCCEAGDDGCGAIVRHGTVYHGSEWDGVLERTLQPAETLN